KVEETRAVILEGLSIRPARDRYKIFIIDEVHQLSMQSFNALLKSIEEPPPHVMFMMATTELDKIPETVLSRSQVYEFRTIGTKAIVAKLRDIVDAEAIEIADESLQLIARDAEGSMRDAQTKLDQVIAFTGTTIAAGDVATVLGLVGRDLLFAFDVLTKAETDIRAAAQPRHHLEMAFLRWIYLRKLVPIEDLITAASGPPAARAPAPAARPVPARGRAATISGSTPQQPDAAAAARVRPAPAAGATPAGGAAEDRLKEALLAEIRKAKVVFYNTVVAQAQRIDVSGDRVTFTFSPNHRTLREMFD